MIKRGCRVALGLDGATLDEDDDALREMRLADLLHAGTGFRIDVEPRADPQRDPGERPPLGDQQGRRRHARAGAPADILLIDWDKLDADRLRPDLDPLDLLFARSTARHIKELIVGGRTVMRDGRCSASIFPP